MTNITTNAISVDAYIQNSSNNFYLIKGVTIPAHSSLELIDGGSKIVVVSGDRLYFQSDTAIIFRCRCVSSRCNKHIGETWDM